MTEHTGEIIMSVAMIFIGCCANMITLELLVKADPSSGPLITFLQFFFIALYGLGPRIQVHLSRFPFVSMKKREVPLSWYLLMVALFFISSVLNNYVYAYRVSVPLNTVLRSSSMVLTVILSAVIRGKVYSVGQVISILLVMIGVITATLAGFDGDTVLDETAASHQLIGILLLMVGLFIASGLGIIQEYCRDRYGRQSSESQFYYHALSIPCFLLMTSNLSSTLLNWQTIQAAGYTYELSLLSSEWTITVPMFYAIVLANCITQLVCVSGVFKLINLTSSLSLQVVLTLRKFISLSISLVFFQHSLNLPFLMGTVCAFGGSLCYTWFTSQQSSPVKKQKTN